MQQQSSTQVVMPEEVNADFTMACMPNISRQARSVVRPGRCLQAVLISVQHLVMSQGRALPQNVLNGLAMFSPEVLSQPSTSTTFPAMLCCCIACQVLLVEQHFTVCSFVLANNG